MANIELDGANKKIKVDSGDLTLDVPGDIILDADGADLVFADGGTNILKVSNSSSDVVLQPQVDAKDIIFKQYDGTTVATVEDNGTFNIPTDKLAINGTAVTSTAAELNIMDGVTSTTAELNILDGVTATAAEINLIDGGTARGTTAIADGDGVLINDDGTMRMTTVQTLKTYMGGGDNTPYFSGRKASAQVITRNSWANITNFTTAEIDSDSAFDGETFTVPSGEGGVYFFGALLESSFGDVGNDGERILASFEKNGSNTNMPREDFAKNSGYNMQRYTNTISAVLNLSAGDTINVAVYNKDGDASGNANVTDESQFFGYKLIT